MIRRNVQTGPALKISPWRKVAIGSWKNVCEASVYGMLEIEAAPALRFLESHRSKSGERTTLTALLVRAVALALKEHPEMNSLLRLGRLYPRKSVDIFVHVAVDEHGKELTGFVVRNADQKSVDEIARECREVPLKIRKGGDAFAKTKKLFAVMPGILARALLGVSSFFLYTLNLWLPFFGPRDGFGSAMVTNVGALGMNTGFAPIAPYTRVPLVVAAGVVTEKATVRGGIIQVAKTLPLGVTFDHRVIDGLRAGQMSARLHEIFKEPEKFF